MKRWFKKKQVAEAAAEHENGGQSTDVGVAPVTDSATASPPVAAPQATTGSPLSRTAALPAAAPNQSPRSLFKQFVESLYDAVLIMDVKGHIVNINVRATEFFGYTAAEAWDLPVSQVVPGISDVVIERIRQGLARERFILMEARCARKDRTTFPAEIAISQVEITNDNNLLFCVRNIERRQQQLTFLQVARRLLDQIPAAAVACDQNATIQVANLALARMLGYDTPDILVDHPFSGIWREPCAAEVIERVLKGESTKEPITIVNRHGRNLQLVASFTPDLDAHQKPIGFLTTFTSAAVVSLNNR